jgi:hypothetical protein
MPSISHVIPAKAGTQLRHIGWQELSQPAASVPAPQIAIDYWKLPEDARLRDVVIAVRADEAGHRDKNHRFADDIDAGLYPGRRGGDHTREDDR